jgi:hypothetical protein
MPLLTQPPPTRAQPGDKRRLAALAAGAALVLGGVAAWTAVHPGSYGQSRAGCVTVTIPSSTGGALLHECGAGARMLCRHAFGHDGKLELLIRPACRQAGLD